MKFPFGKHKHRPSGVIQVKLREVAQLFNSMDPAPFIEKDLDDDAWSFIEGRASDFPTATPLLLVIHLAKAPGDPRAQQTVEAAIQNFFRNRARQAKRDLNQLLRDGRTSLAVGGAFLALCLAAARLVQRLWPEAGMTPWAAEGLTIGGWVAMWRPLEIHLYGWWPLLRRLRILFKLSRIRVRIRVRPPGRGAGEPAVAEGI
ncbi:MAG: hypothetical protein WC789_13585 [Lentisphaeria bacterium]|jgi:hypothetical protein